MPYNHKEVSGEKYPVVIDGKGLELNQEQIGQVIRKKLESNLTVHKLFDQFDTGLERLENLEFQVVDLDGRYAETDESVMKLDMQLFTEGKFFQESFFIVMHELVHWLSRIKEADAYFNDPEEVLGFVASIAYELSQGRDMDIIWNKIYPKVEFHFNSQEDSRDFFKRSIEKAHDLLN